MKEDEAREAKRLDAIRKNYEAFVRGIQVEAGLEHAREEIPSSCEAGEADETDEALAAGYAELQTRLHMETGAFIEACDRATPTLANGSADPDLPDSPDRLSQSGEAIPAAVHPAQGCGRPV
ncbi:MAG TPA: hypothetical protein VF559_12065 [Caulobacteraceae bacterium]